MNKFVKIAVIDNQFEAQLLESALNEQKIAHYSRSYHDLAYDGVFQLQRGWGAIYASEEDRLKIIEIIKEIRKIPQDTEDCS